MPKRPAWEQHRAALATQAEFVRGYSPLTAAMLDEVVRWVADPDARGRELGAPQAVERVAERVLALLEAGDPSKDDAGWINNLEPTLRLQASFHWYVLRNDPRVAGLRPYFKTTAEGEGPGARSPADEDFAARLLAAGEALGDELFERARSWRVQTNETSRGIAWLLPSCLLAAEAIYLVELGCSAGLNLYAEQRSYELSWPDGAKLRLGRAGDEQFRVACDGSRPQPLEAFAEADRQGPEVLARVGGDLELLDPSDEAAAQRLEACIWGDQKRRVDRLREAIAVHRAAQRGETVHGQQLRPAQLSPVELPEIHDFLAEAVPAQPVAPVIAFNTYVTAYLSDVDERALARQMRSFARSWSLRHKLPWMWVHFEPSRGGEAPPHPGWCRWVVELFSGSWTKSIELGWAHPHLVRAEFGPGLVELRGLRELQ